MSFMVKQEDLHGWVFEWGEEVTGGWGGKGMYANPFGFTIMRSS